MNISINPLTPTMAIWVRYDTIQEFNVDWKAE